MSRSHRKPVDSAGSFSNEFGWNTTSVRFMRSLIHWKMDVPSDGTTVAYTPYGRRRHVHEAERSVVESAGFFSQRQRLAPTVTFLSGSTKGLLLASRFELCVVIHTNVVRLSTISRANSLSAETVKECAFMSKPCSIKYFSVKTLRLLRVPSPTSLSQQSRYSNTP